jgi:hypothetical protein
MVTDLTARLPELEAEAEALERKATALRQVVEGIKALNGDATALLLGITPDPNGGVRSQPSGTGLSGRDAIRRIVAERPGIWKVADLRKLAEARGYGVTTMGVEKAVRRMMETGEAVKVGYGRYRFGEDERLPVNE